MADTPTLDRVREMVREMVHNPNADSETLCNEYEWRMSKNVIRDLVCEGNQTKPLLDLIEMERDILSREPIIFFRISCIIIHDEDDVLELNRKG